MDRPLHDIELRIKTAEDKIETLQYDKDLLLGQVDSLAEIIQQLLRTPHKPHHETESDDFPPEQCIILRGVTCIRGKHLYRCVKDVFSVGMRLRNILITKCKIINYNDSDSMHHVLVKLSSPSQKKDVLINKHRLSRCENVTLRNVFISDNEHTCMVQDTTGKHGRPHPPSLMSLDFQQPYQRNIHPQPRAQQKHYSLNQPRKRHYSPLQHKLPTRQSTPHQHQHQPQQHQATSKQRQDIPQTNQCTPRQRTPAQSSQVNVQRYTHPSQVQNSSTPVQVQRPLNDQLKYPSVQQAQYPQGKHPQQHPAAQHKQFPHTAHQPQSPPTHYGSQQSQQNPMHHTVSLQGPSEYTNDFNANSIPMSTNSNVMNQSSREHLLIQQQPTLQPPHHEPIIQQLPVQQPSIQKPLVHQPFTQQQGIISQQGLPQSQQLTPIFVPRTDPYQMHAVAVTEPQATIAISQRTPSQEYHQLQPSVNSHQYNSIASLSNTAQIIKGASNTLYNNDQYDTEFPTLQQYQ